MIHAHFDDDPTSSAHWAAGASTSDRRILIRVSDRVGKQVGVSFDPAQATTFGLGLALVADASLGTTIRSNEPALGGRESWHWSAYACTDKVQVYLRHGDDFATVAMPKAAAADFARNVRARVAETTRS